MAGENPRDLSLQISALVKEELRKLETHKPVKSYKSAPGSSQGGEGELAFYPNKKGIGIALKHNNSWGEFGYFEGVGDPRGSGSMSSIIYKSQSSGTDLPGWGEINRLDALIQAITDRLNVYLQDKYEVAPMVLPFGRVDLASQQGQDDMPVLVVTCRNWTQYDITLDAAIVESDGVTAADEFRVSADGGENWYYDLDDTVFSSMHTHDGEGVTYSVQPVWVNLEAASSNDCYLKLDVMAGTLVIQTYLVALSCSKGVLGDLVVTPYKVLNINGTVGGTFDGDTEDPKVYFKLENTGGQTITFQMEIHDEYIKANGDAQVGPWMSIFDTYETNANLDTVNYLGGTDGTGETGNIACVVNVDGAEAGNSKVTWTLPADTWVKIYPTAKPVAEGIGQGGITDDNTLYISTGWASPYDDFKIIMNADADSALITTDAHDHNYGVAPAFADPDDAPRYRGTIYNNSTTEPAYVKILFDSYGGNDHDFDDTLMTTAQQTTHFQGSLIWIADGDGFKMILPPGRHIDFFFMFTPDESHSYLEAEWQIWASRSAYPSSFAAAEWSAEWELSGTGVAEGYVFVYQGAYDYLEDADPNVKAMLDFTTIAGDTSMPWEVWNAGSEAGDFYITNASAAAKYLITNYVILKGDGTESSSNTLAADAALDSAIPAGGKLILTIEAQYDNLAEGAGNNQEFMLYRTSGPTDELCLLDLYAFKTLGLPGQYTSHIFQRAATIPATPSGGTYAGGLPDPVGNWEDGPPTGTDPIWMSTGIFVYGDAAGPTGGGGGWSTPVEINGDEGDPAGLYSIWSAGAQDFTTPPASPATPTGTPDSPSWTPTADWKNNPETSPQSVWLAISRYSGGSWQAWEVARILGEDGDDSTIANMDYDVEAGEAETLVWVKDGDGAWTPTETRTEIVAHFYEAGAEVDNIEFAVILTQGAMTLNAEYYKKATTSWEDIPTDGTFTEPDDGDTKRIDYTVLGTDTNRLTITATYYGTGSTPEAAVTETFYVVVHGTSGDDAVVYYIKPTEGTAFHTDGEGNTTPATLTLLAMKVTGDGEALCADTIKIYDNTGTLVDNGYTITLVPADIDGDEIFYLRDGPAGTIYDTITIVDIADGTLGAHVKWYSNSECTTELADQFVGFAMLNPETQALLTPPTATVYLKNVGSESTGAMTLSSSRGFTLDDSEKTLAADATDSLTITFDPDTGDFPDNGTALHTGQVLGVPSEGICEPLNVTGKAGVFVQVKLDGSPLGAGPGLSFGDVPVLGERVVMLQLKNVSGGGMDIGTSGLSAIYRNVTSGCPPLEFSLDNVTYASTISEGSIGSWADGATKTVYVRLSPASGDYSKRLIGSAAGGGQNYTAEVKITLDIDEDNGEEYTIVIPCFAYVGSGTLWAVPRDNVIDLGVVPAQGPVYYKVYYENRALDARVIVPRSLSGQIVLHRNDYYSWETSIDAGGVGYFWVEIRHPMPDFSFADNNFGNEFESGDEFNVGHFGSGEQVATVDGGPESTPTTIKWTWGIQPTTTCWPSDKYIAIPNFNLSDQFGSSIDPCKKILDMGSVLWGDDAPTKRLLAIRNVSDDWHSSLYIGVNVRHWQPKWQDSYGSVPYISSLTYTPSPIEITTAVGSGDALYTFVEAATQSMIYQWWTGYNDEAVGTGLPEKALAKFELGGRNLGYGYSHFMAGGDCWGYLELQLRTPSNYAAGADYSFAGFCNTPLLFEVRIYRDNSGSRELMAEYFLSAIFQARGTWKYPYSNRWTGSTSITIGWDKTTILKTTGAEADDVNIWVVLASGATDQIATSEDNDGSYTVPYTDINNAGVTASGDAFRFLVKAAGTDYDGDSFAIGPWMWRSVNYGQELGDAS